MQGISATRRKVAPTVPGAKSKDSLNFPIARTGMIAASRPNYRMGGGGARTEPESFRSSTFERAGRSVSLLAARASTAVCDQCVVWSR